MPDRRTGVKGAGRTSGAKINVYLRPEIIARLATYGTRINVSRVCAQALAAEMDRLDEIEQRYQRWLEEMHEL